jgi:hypothetical protein
MLYDELYNYLKDRISFTPEKLCLPEIGQELTNYDFFSESHTILSNAAKEIYPIDYTALTPSELEAGGLMKSVTRVPDEEIEENRNFRYHVFSPKNSSKADKVTILLHGFNERSWTKYLPWAAELVALTQRTVILFPIAFHMNRSPAQWTDPRDMRAVSQLRKKLHPNIIGSTLSNAAISVRLSVNPLRFFFSGLESIFDVNLLVKRIKDGNHPNIQKGAQINFFTYSIGTLLGELVMMTDIGGYLNDANFVAFCGGPTFNRLCPVSKFILDSEASLQVYSYLVEHLESHIKKDPALASYLKNNESPLGRNIKTMLNYHVDLQYREEKFRELAPRFLAVTLKNDTVVPPYEVVGTLKGIRRDIPITVYEEDPPYPLRHEDPFPIATKKGDEIDATFHKLFKLMGEFLR